VTLLCNCLAASLGRGGKSCTFHVIGPKLQDQYCRRYAGHAQVQVCSLGRIKKEDRDREQMRGKVGCDRDLTGQLHEKAGCGNPRHNRHSQGSEWVKTATCMKCYKRCAHSMLTGTTSGSRGKWGIKWQEHGKTLERCSRETAELLSRDSACACCTWRLFTDLNFAPNGLELSDQVGENWEL